MKHRKKTSSNMQKNRIKRPAAGWLIFFAVLLLLFAAFIYGGIKAGQKAGELRQKETSSVTVMTEVNV